MKNKELESENLSLKNLLNRSEIQETFVNEEKIKNEENKENFDNEERKLQDFEKKLFL